MGNLASETFDFWPPESRFLMSKSEKNVSFSKPFNGRVLIFWNLILSTFLCTKIKKITTGIFFLLMHVSSHVSQCQNIQEISSPLNSANPRATHDHPACLTIYAWGKMHFWDILGYFGIFFWKSSRWKMLKVNLLSGSSALLVGANTNVYQTTNLLLCEPDIWAGGFLRAPAKFQGW